MQRIERYGVIALVFLLVTILAVSIWGEGQAQDVLASVKDKASGVLGGVAAADADSGPSTELVPGGRRAAKRSLPLADRDVSAPRKRSGRKGGLRRDESLDDAFVALGSRSTGTPVPTPASRVVVPDRQPRASGSAAGAKPVTQKSATQKPGVQPSAQRRASAPAGSRTYTVRSGDTMGEIAQRELGTYKRWGEIQTLNGGLDPAKLRVGMEIKLPSGARKTQPVAKASTQKVAAAQPRSGDARYSVRKGDSLSAIAQRELGTASRWKEIVALNPGIDPQRLAVGAKLVLPEGLRLPPVRTQQVAALSPTEGGASRGRVR